MEITGKNTTTGEKIILTSNASEDRFFRLIGKAIKRFGRKTEGHVDGFYWADAHKLTFTAGGYEFRVEYLSEFVFFN